MRREEPLAPAAHQLGDAAFRRIRGGRQAGHDALLVGFGVEVVAGPYVVPRNDIVLRPLAPPLIRAIALAWRRDKPNDPALRIVREALMTLKEAVIAPSFMDVKGATQAAPRTRKKAKHTTRAR